ncbi:MAG: hypothetical protein FWG05_05365 [Kiritimatiellaeota bacterium]|nr:hypothetical protein [Kiritimatiellota bacterium]
MLLAVCLTATATAGQSHQFRSSEYSGGSWESANGSSASLRSVHQTTNGWAVAEKRGGKNGGVWFDCNAGGVPSPLGFDRSATNLIAHVFAVVIADETSSLATAISAPCAVRFVEDGDGSFFSASGSSEERELSDSFRGMGNDVSVNARVGKMIVPGPKPQLVECVFGEPVGMNRLYFGGAPASNRWGRNWRGAFVEILCFGEALDERRANAVRRYLSVRNGMRLPTESDCETTPILKALGLNHGGAFSTILFVK